MSPPEIKGKYPHNTGTIYAASYELVERALGARKAMRDFEAFEEPRGKCTVCGEREALNDGSHWSGREFWKEVAGKLQGDVEQGGRERLCAVCAVKRFIQPFVFQKELKISADFPSTDSVAATPFVEEVLKRIREEEIKNTVEAFCKALKDSPLRSIAFTKMDIPT